MRLELPDTFAGNAFTRRGARYSQHSRRNGARMPPSRSIDHRLLIRNHRRETLVYPTLQSLMTNPLGNHPRSAPSRHQDPLHRIPNSQNRKRSSRSQRQILEAR